MKKLHFPFLAILAAVLLAACGTATPPPTQHVALDRGQDVTFKSVSSQTPAKEVKIVFTEIVPGDDTPAFFFQSFSDGELMKGSQKIFNGHPLFSGLILKPKISTEQLEIEYDPELWEVMP